MAQLLCRVLCVLLLAGLRAAESAKGVFETCPACRLNAMPELKRFLHESVLKKEYGDALTVNFIPGKTPTLLLYDDAGKQTSSTEVDPKLNFDALHQWVQGLGFKKQQQQSSVAAALPSNPAASQAAAGAAAASAGTSAAAAGIVGAAPVPAQEEQLVQLQQRRRRRRHRRRRMRQRGRPGAEGGAGAAGGARHHRRRQHSGVAGDLY